MAPIQPKRITVLEVKYLGWTDTLPERIRVKDYNTTKTVTLNYKYLPDIGATVADIVVELMRRIGFKATAMCHDTNGSKSLLMFDEIEFSLNDLKGAYDLEVPHD